MAAVPCGGLFIWNPVDLQLLHLLVTLCLTCCDTHLCQLAAHLMLAPSCRGLESNERMSKLRREVESFAGGFEMPGFDVRTIANQNGAMQNGHH